MRITWLFVVIMLTFLNVGYCADYVISARLVSNDEAEKYEKAQKLDEFIDGNQGNLLQKIDDGSKIYHNKIVAKDIIVLKCFDKDTKNQAQFVQCGVENIEIYVDNVHAQRNGVNIVDKLNTEIVYQIEIKKIDGFESKPDGTLLTIKINKTGGKTETFAGCRKNKVTPYGYDIFKSNTFGLWVPLGLIGTNFENTQNGIEFSAMPVNIGVGSQIWLSRDNYIGISGLAGWAITSSGDKSSESATLSTFSTGLLFDFSSVFYIGPTYIFDFRSGHPDRKWFITLGVGPKLIDFMSGKGK